MKTELVEELNRVALAEARQGDLIAIAIDKFGFSERIEVEINSINDVDRLQRMLRSAHRTNSLDELLTIQ